MCGLMDFGGREDERWYPAPGTVSAWQRSCIEAGVFSQRNTMRNIRRKRRKANGPCIAEIFAGAVRHHQSGRLAEAVAQYELVISLDPDHADVHNNLGVAFVQLGRIDEARTHFERAVILNPDYADAHNNLGNSLAAQARFKDAVAHFERAWLLNPNLAGTQKNAGAALMQLDRIDEAAEHYRRVLATNPDDAEAYQELGNVLKAQGKLDEALRHYERAIAIRPTYAEAHYSRAEVKTFQSSDPELAALDTLAGRDDLPVNKAPFIHFALAKAFEDCEDYARAFAHLRRGNDLKRRQIHYDEPAVAGYFQRIRAVFNCSLLNRFQGEGDPAPAPIFVLGMPRSGSTLIEQILASHSQIHGAGELTDLETAIRTVLDGGDRPVRFPECVPLLDGPALRRLGQTYLAGLPALADGKVRIVDKSPGNFLNIGLIRLILPNARIIHTVRDPMDTCVSCYSRLFTFGQDFSYDLAELGRFYRGYAELMAHWRTILPSGAILDVSYEEVVNDLEGQARRLIDFCGLPWEDRCLEFHKNIRPVRTASAVQVRKPVFRGSLQRWRKYEAGLMPLLHELRDILPDEAAVLAIRNAAHHYLRPGGYARAAGAR